MNTDKALAPGTQLRSPAHTYTIRSVIGRGGFGITYTATYSVVVNGLPIKAVVAIKEHFISEMCDRDSTTSRILYSQPVAQRVEASRKDFISEARRLRQVGEGQPNIVKVSEVFEANDSAYYVMEYLEGQSLKDYVSVHGPLDIGSTLDIMVPVIKAVAHLHTRLMTHLDIKPANIMVTHDEEGRLRPVLIDFGLCKHYNDDGSATSTINTQGFSDGYAPIEQYAGINTFSPASDVYSLAATMLYCLTGKTPAKAIELDAATAIPAGLPANVHAALVNALQMRRADRPANAQVFLDQLFANTPANTARQQPATPVDPTVTVMMKSDDPATVMMGSGSGSYIPPTTVDDNEIHNGNSGTSYYNDDEDNDDDDRDNDNHKSGHKWLFIIIALLVAAGVGIGAYFIWFKQPDGPAAISFSYSGYNNAYETNITNTLMVYKEGPYQGKAVWCLESTDGYMLPVAWGTYDENSDKTYLINFPNGFAANENVKIFRNGAEYSVSIPNVNDGATGAYYTLDISMVCNAEDEPYTTLMTLGGNGNQYLSNDIYSQGGHNISQLLNGTSWSYSTQYGSGTITFGQYTAHDSFTNNDGNTYEGEMNYLLLNNGLLGITSGDNLKDEFVVADLGNDNTLPERLEIRRYDIRHGVSDDASSSMTLTFIQ